MNIYSYHSFRLMKTCIYCLLLISFFIGGISWFGTTSLYDHEEFIPLPTESFISRDDSLVHRLMETPNTTYVIERDYMFKDTLVIPNNCELRFRGGTMHGPIIFNNTLLSGNVNLVGASLKGSIRNKRFYTSWNCYRDGKHDDAPNINSAVRVCNEIYFSKGTYALNSRHTPNCAVNIKALEDKVDACIGIFRDSVHFFSKEDVTLVTNYPYNTICVYSPPNKIEASIKDISINGLNFVSINKGDIFHEFVHTIKVIGVNGLTIRNCVFNDFWGDAICLSHYGDTPNTGERTRNINVRVICNKIRGGEHHNNRNGISVISGENVYIYKNTISQTSKSNMPGAIDVEPNNSANYVYDIKISRNHIKNCMGTAGGICIHANKYGGKINKVTIEDNTIEACSSGIAFVVMDSLKSGDYIIKNNNLRKNKRSFLFVGKGYSYNWIVENNKCRDDLFKSNFGGSIHIKSLKKNK